MYGIGTDIVVISRVARWADDDAALGHVYTKNEQASVLATEHSAKYLAAAFAVKEAFMKAIGTGWGEGVQWKDIEVVNGKGGVSVRLYNRAKELCGGRVVYVSTGCSRDLMVAVVVIE